MLEQKDSFPTTPMAIHDCGYSGTDPLNCYGQAIEIAKTDPFILNWLAQVFHFLGKQDMAIGICNKGLNILPDPKANWQAYSTRAKVCYYMGVDVVQELWPVYENALNSALVFFAKAMECDPGDTLPEIHFLRGKCLQVKGEEHNAVKCFKQAIELDDVGSQYPESFRCLMELLLSLFTQGRSIEEIVSACSIHSFMSWRTKYQMKRVRQELHTVYRNHIPKILQRSRAKIIAGKLQLVVTAGNIEP